MNFDDGVCCAGPRRGSAALLFYPGRDARPAVNHELKKGREGALRHGNEQQVGTAASTPVPEPEVPERARNRTFSTRYKLDILKQYE